ncbi:hypothetical protein EV421DRAFT_916339 [Armillaria borealis]|uniref:Transmembrane protein n=1 Tax=Armillaria borealis TaxID=47425 RepID=A0AA39K1J5_9AGAR|nr:hypothetical protein EV421DRAFT_916339 [Armillaria borealis]
MYKTRRSRFEGSITFQRSLANCNYRVCPLAAAFLPLGCKPEANGSWYSPSIFRMASPTRQISSLPTSHLMFSGKSIVDSCGENDVRHPTHRRQFGSDKVIECGRPALWVARFLIKTTSPTTMTPPWHLQIFVLAFTIQVFIIQYLFFILPPRRYCNLGDP